MNKLKLINVVALVLALAAGAAPVSALALWKYDENTGHADSPESYGMGMSSSVRVLCRDKTLYATFLFSEAVMFSDNLDSTTGANTMDLSVNFDGETTVFRAFQLAQDAVFPKQDRQGEFIAKMKKHNAMSLKVNSFFPKHREGAFHYTLAGSSKALSRLARKCGTSIGEPPAANKAPKCDPGTYYGRACRVACSDNYDCIGRGKKTPGHPCYCLYNR